MKLDKQSYTFPAQESSPDLCYTCDNFDESKHRNIGAKGGCNPTPKKKKKWRPIYRTDFAVCLDYKKKKEISK